MQRDLRVVGSGLWVRDVDRAPIGIGRVRDVPLHNARHVDACHEQARSIGRPPVSRLPPHLLGGNELRRTVCDVLVLRRREDALAASIDTDDVQRAALHVCDGGAGRIHLGIDRDAARRQLSDTARREVDDVQPAGEVERRSLKAGLCRETNDPARGLACPFATRPLLRRNLAAVITHQRRGIHDQPLGTGCNIQNPEAGDLIVAGA